MTLKFEDGTIKISESYSLKVPTTQQYSSHDAYSGITVEIPFDGDPTEAAAEAREIAAYLSQQVKLHVFAQLGVEFTETSEGVLQPKLPESAPKAAATVTTRRTSGGYQTKGQSSGGGGRSGGYSRPPADLSSMPRFEADFGRGLAEFIDVRPLKESGRYKPTSPDFKNAEKGSDEAYWLYSKDGNLNESVAVVLDEIGVEV